MLFRTHRRSGKPSCFTSRTPRPTTGPTASAAAFWGVLVIDMLQFFIKMTAVIAAAYFAVELPQVGGLHGLVEKLSHVHGPGGLNYINILPDFTNNWDLAVAIFVMPLAVQWWAVWYPGAEHRMTVAAAEPLSR